MMCATGKFSILNTSHILLMIFRFLQDQKGVILGVDMPEVAVNFPRTSYIVLCCNSQQNAHLSLIPLCHHYAHEKASVVASKLVPIFPLFEPNLFAEMNSERDHSKNSFEKLLLCSKQ